VATERRIDFAKQRAVLDKSIERMRSAPDRVARGGPAASVRVRKDRVCEATIRQFTFLIDEPVERGGTDVAPAAMEYFVAGAAG
jgi:hypothetical protein